MLFQKKLSALCLLAGAACSAGCENTAPVLFTQDAGSDAASSDAQTRQGQLTYRPVGCDYDVATPQVYEALENVDAYGTGSPEHIHLSWAGPTDTTFAVNWRTDLTTTASHVLYGTDESAVTAADGATTGVTDQLGHSMRGNARDQERIHEAHVCGLTPSTAYFYKVGGPGHWGPVYSATTGPAVGSTETFSFAVTGDSRGNEENSWAISQKRVVGAAPDFQLFSGDAVFLGTAQNMWRDFFYGEADGVTIESSLATIPFMVANGNHDALAVPYLAQFALPQQVSPAEQGQGEEWYSFEYGNAHFVVLNDTVLSSSVIGGEEASWLEADLSAIDHDKIDWIFAIHHRPLYTCQSTHMPDTAQRSAWQPIFEEHNVDIVFAGHNHVYERSKPIHGLESGQGVVAPQDTNGTPQISGGVPSGTIYIVSAGVGAPLYPVSTECPTSYAGQSTRSYVNVQIADRTITVTAYDVMNDMTIDSFTYSK